MLREHLREWLVDHPGILAVTFTFWITLSSHLPDFAPSGSGSFLGP